MLSGDRAGGTGKFFPQLEEKGAHMSSEQNGVQEKVGKDESLWKVGFGELGAAIKILGNFGVTPDHLRLIRNTDDRSYAELAAHFIRVVCGPTTPVSLARYIMGQRMVDAEQAAAIFPKSKWQKSATNAEQFVNFSPTTIFKLSQTHHLFFVPPIYPNAFIDAFPASFCQSDLGKISSVAVPSKLWGRWFLVSDSTANVNSNFDVLMKQKTEFSGPCSLRVILLTALLHYNFIATDQSQCMFRNGTFTNDTVKRKGRISVFFENGVFSVFFDGETERSPGLATGRLMVSSAATLA